jgi:hypothetical protein
MGGKKGPQDILRAFFAAHVVRPPLRQCDSRPLSGPPIAPDTNKNRLSPSGKSRFFSSIDHSKRATIILEIAQQ